jgi:S1-C subfamily serine protease
VRGAGLKATVVALTVAVLGSALLWLRDPSPSRWQKADPSVVEVLATGCRGQELRGSGAVVRADRVATVAHLVAGARSVVVRAEEGRGRRARVSALDPERDLALLEVDGLDVAALPRADAKAREEGWMLSPGARVEALPFRVARRVRARIADAERDALEIEADVDPGDSGAALVDARGRLVGIVFAASRERAAGWAIPAGELDALPGFG